MSVQVENLEKNMAKLIIEVPAEELEKALEKAYQKQKKNISVPGFRKGKVPRAMVEKMYGPAVFYEDAVNSLVPEEYSKAAEESKLDIVSRPEINVEQIEKGKAFIFTATVAVKPEVTLGEYKGLEVAKADTTVTDEEVEAELKKEQEKNARTINVEDRPAADGDTVTLDFEGSVDGVPFDGGAGKDYPLTLGSHSFIPGFEEQLVGAALDFLCKYLLVLKSGISRIQYDIVSKVKNFLQSSRRNVKDQSHTGRNSFEIPDVGYRSCQLNVSHTLTAHTGFCYFYAASVADYAFVANFLIFTAMALPVFARSKNLLTEKTIFFRFQCSIVDCFRFFNFTAGPFSDLFRGC